MASSRITARLISAGMGALMLCVSSLALAEAPRVHSGSVIGPFNGQFLAGGTGI